MEIPKWQHELSWYFKRGKLVSYFLNYAKTCLYGLKISEKIKIRYFFQSGAFFHLSSNFHTSCVSTFKFRKGKTNFWKFWTSVGHMGLKLWCYIITKWHNNRGESTWPIKCRVWYWSWSTGRWGGIKYWYG